MKLRYPLVIAGALAALAVGALAQQPGVGSNLPSMFAIPIDNKSPTFGAGIRGLVPASSATDIYTLCGSANRVIRISYISVSGRATSVAAVDISLVLRTTANSGGTFTWVTPVRYDSTMGSATVSGQAYTANPTLGTSVGPGGMLATKQLTLGNLTTGVGLAPIEWSFGNRPSSQIVLRGTSQCLGINMNAQSASGGLFEVYVEWTENSN